LSEESSVSQNTTGAESDQRMSTLVEVGQVSRDTHGFVHGLEFGFLPHS